MSAARPARWLAPFALALVIASPAWAKRDGKGREIEIWSGDPLFALTSPWSGARLAAGETVRLAWNAEAALANESWIEEWEAFLSLDAGQRYTVRLTPHLDLEKRTFSIRLPDIPTREARLMFRMGNERRELELELPWTFEIVETRSLASAVRRRAFGRGEEARSGDQGVVAWVQGGRDGSGAVEVVTDLPPDGLRSVSSHAGLAFAAVGPQTRSRHLSLPAPFAHPESEESANVEQTASADPLIPNLHPLRSTCRQNE